MAAARDRQPAWAWRLLLASVTFAASNASATPPADAQADRVCTLGPASTPPAPQTLNGCAQAACTVVGEQLLCACKTASAWEYQRRTKDQVVQRWRTEVSPMTGAGGFEVRSVEIADDGRPRWLVARWLATSNGLGVSTHALCVLDPYRSAALPAAAPVCRSVQEWQALSILVQEPGRAGCSLMDGAWQSGREPGRGPGTYAAGRLWRWQNEQWHEVPTQQRQAVARRLSTAFMDQREALPRLQSTAGRLWYQHATTQTAVCPGLLCRQANWGR